MNEKRIIITVEGGLIQNIDGIPAGVVVEVHDYDLDEGDEDEDTKNDADGNSYREGIWEAE